MKTKLFLLLLSLFLFSSCTSEKADTDDLKMINNSKIINISDNSSSLKRKAQILSDDMLIGAKTESWDKQLKKPVYNIETPDEEKLFSVVPVNPENLFEKTFSAYAIYDFDENLSGYIQSDVFRGNESYIIYNPDKEKLAFCYTDYIDENKEYKIISFEDELLYKITVKISENEDFDMIIENMREDSETDIYALALSFLINTDEYTDYQQLKEENKK